MLLYLVAHHWLDGWWTKLPCSATYLAQVAPRLEDDPTRDFVDDGTVFRVLLTLNFADQTLGPLGPILNPTWSSLGPLQVPLAP